ncbi:hypothetical protein M9H77_32346 [Catharanthus roseus]|uniref:Uncharacterized protein n=1 Tax=Catharanthus roseus TaxID=4058 RepID=A0ACC0A3I9_CATRO|nr:hypothetical protein M9H77_32346 [Catharanthus roseus]
MATQMEESIKKPLEPFINHPPFVHLNINISTLFCPAANPINNHKVFKGVTTIAKKLLLSSTIDSPNECKENLKSILADLGVSMDFWGCNWRHKYMTSDEIYEMPNVEDMDGLMENLCWFLYEVKTEQKNKGFSLLPVNLAIMRRVVVIDDDEFDIWCSAFQEEIDDVAVRTEYDSLNSKALKQKRVKHFKQKQD